MSEPVTEAPAEASHEISKKELLAQTGISYGQLYRWKREGLIPEEWFEKRSAFTGQETFFPRTLVLERVRAIQSMKDGLSLSEIREQLASLPKQASLYETLLATSDMSEQFLMSLTVDLEAVQLSEPSVKAVVTLSSALDKAAARKKVKRELISLAIKALNMEAPALPDAPETEELATCAEALAAAADSEPLAPVADPEALTPAADAEAEAEAEAEASVDAGTDAEAPANAEAAPLPKKTITLTLETDPVETATAQEKG